MYRQLLRSDKYCTDVRKISDGTVPFDLGLTLNKRFHETERTFSQDINLFKLFTEIEMLLRIGDNVMLTCKIQRVEFGSDYLSRLFCHAMAICFCKL